MKPISGKRSQRIHLRYLLVVMILSILTLLVVTRERVVQAVMAPANAELHAALDGPLGPPVATLGPDISVIENTHLIIKLDGFDPNPGAILTGFIIYISNAGTLFDVNPDGTRGAIIGSVTPQLGVAITNPERLVWYEPNPNFFGIDGFQYYLTDNLGGASFLRTVTIHTTRLNPAPRAVSAIHHGVSAAPLTGIVLNISCPQCLELTGHLTQFPNAGRLYRSILATPESQVTPANPTFTGIQLYYVSDDFPNPSTDSFSYFVSDGILSSPVVTDFVDLQSPGALPNSGSTPSIFATTENTPLQIILRPVDPGGATSSLQIELTAGPQNGSLCQLNLLNICQPVTPGNDLIGPEPDGNSWAITYTPNNGFTSDGGSPDSFSYTLTTAAGISAGPFTVQVYVLGITNPANCSAISISPGMVPGGNLNADYTPVTFTAGGGTAPNTLIEIGALPAGMSFTDGVLSGTPTEAGAFSFVVVATDANNCTATSAYEFTILNPPPGISAADPFSVRADGTASLNTIATVSDPALLPGTLSVRVVSAPTGINVAGLKNTGGNITAYVGADCGTAPGAYSVSLEVSDGGTTSGTNLTVNVSATPEPALTLSYPSPVTVREGQSVVVNPTTPLTGGNVTRALLFNNGPGGYDGTISTDSNGVLTIGHAGPAGNIFTVDVTVLFPCGATRDAIFTLAVPISCPPNITQANDLNQCGATVSYAAPAGNDVTCSPVSGTFFPPGVTTVTCSKAGTLGCMFTVTVVDTQPPSIACPVNITRSTDPDRCAAAVTYTLPALSDNCAGTTEACIPASGSSFPKGTTTVTCTATDLSGNQATCAFTVSVNDTQAPNITCPAAVTAVAPVACPILTGTTVNYPRPTVSDNCPGVTIACVPASGSSFPCGTTTVTCTATDTSANQSSCSFTVSVFNVCLQDDSNSSTKLLIDTVHGAYRFTCGGVSYVGAGAVLQSGCTFSLSQDAADRRVRATFSTSTKSGSASIQTPIGVVRGAITDRNMTDNNCPGTAAP